MKYLSIVVGLYFLLPSLATAGKLLVTDELNYVPNELLIIPKQGIAIQNINMAVMNKATPNASFMRVRLPKGSDVLAEAAALANQPWVQAAEPNYIYKASALPNDPMLTDYWGLRNLGQTVNLAAGISGADIAMTKAWDVQTDCSTVTVAVIDTGVNYNHPDLATNMWTNAAEIANDGIDNDGIDNDGNGFIDDTLGWDFVQQDKDPMDFNLHGTHVAGTIGAVGNNAVGGSGVCWTAKIMPVRVLDAGGSGRTSGILAGFDYAVANGAKVINMSLGGSGFSSLMNTAIVNANTSGVLVIASAGNSAVNNDVSPSYPASYAQPNIISVAATTQTDTLASFSNFGTSSVDIAAPGTNIKSTVVDRLNNYSENFDTGAAPGWTLATFDNYGAVVPNTVAVTNELSVSPNFSLTDSPGGTYGVNRTYEATSPLINLTGKQGSSLSAIVFWNLDTYSVGDRLGIDVSVDSGLTWIPKTAVFGVGAAALTLDVSNLDGYANVKFRARLTSDGSAVYDGFHIDDVVVASAGLSTANVYGFYAGTSMAAPHVAGLAALIMAAEPTLTNLQVKDRILNTGDNLAALVGKTVSGRRINAQMAMPLFSPTLPAGTVNSATQVALTWVDNSVSEISFLVQRDSGAGFVTVATLATDTTSYTDSAAPASTALIYQVVAKSRDDRIATSATVNVTTPAAPTPPIVQGGGGCIGGTMSLGTSLLILFGALAMRRFQVRKEERQVTYHT